MPGERLLAVFRDIDAANSEDPRRVLVKGIEKPFEVVYSQRMTERLALMYPAASELLQIAARGQHIRRWRIARALYPDGRAGYEQWRRACREHHVLELGAILTRHGFEAAKAAHVAKLIRKEQLKKDAESQALENVVDVVFVEHYLADFLAKHGDYDDAKVVDIVAKILRKMSKEGHAAGLALPLQPEIRTLIDRAMARERDVP